MMKWSQSLIVGIMQMILLIIKQLFRIKNLKLRKFHWLIYKENTKNFIWRVNFNGY